MQNALCLLMESSMSICLAMTPLRNIRLSVDENVPIKDYGLWIFQRGRAKIKNNYKRIIAIVKS